MGEPEDKILSGKKFLFEFLLFISFCFLMTICECEVGFRRTGLLTHLLIDEEDF